MSTVATHDFPIQATAAHALGLRVSTAMPTEVRTLLRLRPGKRPRDVVWYLANRRERRGEASRGRRGRRLERR